MALGGALVEWNDARGFGFIEADDGARYFVHISEVGLRQRRPNLGDRVSFVPKIGEDGRKQAASVRIAGATKPLIRPVGKAPTSRPQSRFEWRLPVAAAFVGLLVCGWVLGAFPLWLPALYLLGGLLTFFSYLIDKRAAQAGQWRTSEAMLHGLDLVFGIVGGLAGQIILRHKTRKPDFAAITGLIAALHVLCLFAILGGWLDIRQMGFALGLN
jgi:uncharacterized membrane protein YsdA (DUF1294 family)/cold shock CspA family protein